MLDDGLDMYNHVYLLFPSYGCEFNEGLYFHARSERNSGGTIFSSEKNHSLPNTTFI